MTDYSEIIVRLGADSKALFNGLEKTGAGMRGWAASLVGELQGKFGKMFAAGAALYGAERFYETLKNKVFAIKNLSEDTGLSVSFIQGAFKKLADDNENFEQVVRPLTLLTTQTGNAKKYLSDLADAYVKLNTQEEKNAFLKAQGIKGWQTLIPLIENGRQGIEDLEKPTADKYSERDIANIVTLSRAGKDLMGGTGKFGGKLLSQFVGSIFDVGIFIRTLIDRIPGHEPKEGVPNLIEDFKRHRSWFQERALNSNNRAIYAKMEAEASKQGFSLEEKRLDLEKSITKELQNREKLTDRIADRSKFTVSELSERYRQLTGDTGPKGLAGMYAITPAMMSANRIKTLEEQAQVAQAFGNAGLADSLMSQADRMRELNPALKSSEQFPLKDIQQNVSTIDENLRTIRAKLSAIPTPP